jgi:hypothetical protein
MIIRPQLILTFLACGAATCSLSGQALSGSYTALYAFGDSLSDAGNVFAVTSMTSPLPAFYTDGTVTGRFTNGLNWVDITSQRLGLGTSVPFALGGNNLAWGGAMTGSGLTSAGIPNVGTQIGQYLTDRGSFPAQSLITLWAGANDYLGGGVQDPQAVVNNLLQHLATMYQFGGRHFVVGNLPDLGQTPLAAFTLDEQGRMGLSMLVMAHRPGTPQAAPLQAGPFAHRPGTPQAAPLHFAHRPGTPQAAPLQARPSPRYAASGAPTGWPAIAQVRRKRRPYVGAKPQRPACRIGDLHRQIQSPITRGWYHRDAQAAVFAQQAGSLKIFPSDLLAQLRAGIRLLATNPPRMPLSAIVGYPRVAGPMPVGNATPEIGVAHLGKGHAHALVPRVVIWPAECDNRPAQGAQWMEIWFGHFFGGHRRVVIVVGQDFLPGVVGGHYTSRLIFD